MPGRLSVKPGAVVGDTDRDLSILRMGGNADLRLRAFRNRIKGVVDEIVEHDVELRRVHADPAVSAAEVQVYRRAPAVKPADVLADSAIDSDIFRVGDALIGKQPQLGHDVIHLFRQWRQVGHALREPRPVLPLIADFKAADGGFKRGQRLA